MAFCKDLSGRVFGEITVIKNTQKLKRRYALWECICSCGNKVERVITQLVNKKHPSCGCVKIKRERVLKGNVRDQPEYKIYSGMLSRCYNQNRKKFAIYGGRGIVVCQRWRESYYNFLEDMGKKPSVFHSIERLDNNGNYEPSNCKWATIEEQARNKSNTKLTLEKAREIRISQLRNADLARKYGVTATTIFYIKANKQWKDTPKEKSK